MRRLRIVLVAVWSSSCASGGATGPAPQPVAAGEGGATAGHARASTSVPASAPAFVPPSYPVTSAADVATLDDHAWPPRVGGGVAWKAFERPWMHAIPGAPPTFYTTSVQPDPKRKAKVDVVALDARQLELELAVGKEGPWPPDEKANGKWPRAGVGKLPKDPAIAPRVVVAFNGAFRLDHDAHGMMIRRRTFAPPVKGVASLLMHDDGRLGFGTWADGATLPADVRSLRQNLEPLLQDGVFNPFGRKSWGGILGAKKGDGQRAKRSGLCRTDDGNLLYLWGDGLEPKELAAAMKDVGCGYGMHLDMNPIHVGFVFLSYDDAQYKKGKSEVLSPALGISPTKYVSAPNPKEFFFGTLRAPHDPAWAPDGQVQPAPIWLPAVVARQDGAVRLTFVDHRRVRFAATAGHDERDASGARIASPAPLDAAAARRVLAALDLGVSPVGPGSLGLVARGVPIVPLRPGALALVLGDDGRLRWGDGVGARWAIEVAPAGEGDEPSLVFGVTALGDLVVAQGPRAAAVEALGQAGCARVASPRSAGAFLRAGRDPIAAGGPGTRLYVLGERPDDSTYRFDREPR